MKRIHRYLIIVSIVGVLTCLHLIGYNQIAIVIQNNNSTALGPEISGSGTYGLCGNPEHFMGSLNGWDYSFVELVDGETIERVGYYDTYDSSGAGGSFCFYGISYYDSLLPHNLTGYCLLEKDFDLDDGLPYSEYNGYVTITDAVFYTDFYIHSEIFDNENSHVFIYVFIVDDQNNHYKIYGDIYGSGSNDTPPEGWNYEIAYDPSEPGGMNPNHLHHMGEEWVRIGSGYQFLETFLNSHSTSTHMFRIYYKIYLAFDDRYMDQDEIYINIDDIRLTINYNYDDGAPNTVCNLVGTYLNGWYYSDVNVTLPATDVGSPTSGVANTYYKINGGDTQVYSEKFILSDEGVYTIEYWSVDNAGNEETHKYEDVKINKNMPPLIFINQPIGNDLYGKASPDFNVEINDPEIDTMWYTLNGGLTNRTFTSNGTIDQALWNAHGNGTVTIEFYANDTGGNIGYAEVMVRKDIITPMISIIRPISSQEYIQAPFFNISIDQTDINTTWYTLDGGITNITFSGIEGLIDEIAWFSEPNGPVTIRFYANDSLNNVGYGDVTINKVQSGIDLLFFKMVNELFTEDYFNITFSIIDDTGQGIDSAEIQLWWNGTEVSGDVQNRGNGFFFVSLEPIFVSPEEDPIILEIIVNAPEYQELNHQLEIAVDPDSVIKKEPPHNIPGYPILVPIGITSSAIVGVYLFLKRKYDKK